eukprot:gene29608-38730_t
MSSKAFLKDYPPIPQLQNINNPVNIRPEYINELSQNLNKHGSTFVDAQIHSNIDSLLQIHRRKMLRRAANRKSAQLSRARKKAHLEELKVENSRLQRLVDVLDSQPELVFCVTALGRITYVSERTINFIKINLSGEESDEDPTHISQILNTESAQTVLEAITQLKKYSSTQSNDGDANMVFSAKEVYFHDAFGHPLVGYLRCSKVFRRTTLQELQNAEGMEELSATAPTPSRERSDSNVPAHSSTAGSVASTAKKPRVSKNASSKGAVETPTASVGATSLGHEITMPAITHTKGAIAEKINNAPTNASNDLEDWNLSKFKLLTDCASSLTGDEALPSASPKFADISRSAAYTTTAEQYLNYESASSSSSAAAYNNEANGQLIGAAQSGGGNSSTTNSTQQQQQQQALADTEDEFVCVIRTSDNCFAPHRMSNCDLLMFSSLLSTASIVAHDLGLQETNSSHPHRRGSSPNGSNGSSRSKNSSDAPPNSDSSKETNKNGTSSETGSEDNNTAESDST